MEFIQISSLLSIQMSEKISQMLTHFRSRFHVSCVFTVLPSSHTNTYAYLNTNTSSFYKNVDTNCFFETFLVTFFLENKSLLKKSIFVKKKTTMWTIKLWQIKWQMPLLGQIASKLIPPSLFGQILSPIIGSEKKCLGKVSTEVYFNEDSLFKPFHKTGIFGNVEMSLSRFSSLVNNIVWILKSLSLFSLLISTSCLVFLILLNSFSLLLHWIFHSISILLSIVSLVSFEKRKW